MTHPLADRQARGSRPQSRRARPPVQQRWRSAIASGHIPGAVALVARHGKVAYHESFGRLDPASDAPMTHDAIFRIYSMTKAIVSVAVMMLWEEGRLLLSDPISKYIPAFAATRVGVVSGDSYEPDRRPDADNRPGPAAPHLRPDL